MNLVWGLQGKKEIGVEKAGTEGGAGEGRPPSPHRHCHRKGAAPWGGGGGDRGKYEEPTAYEPQGHRVYMSAQPMEAGSTKQLYPTDEETESERPGELLSAGSYHGLR